MARILLTLLMCLANSVSLFATQRQPPNVVLFLADDARWGEYGQNGNTQVRTPHIDAIARDGLAAKCEQLADEDAARLGQQNDLEVSRTTPWRLVNGRELYNIKADPGQERNVIAGHAAQANKMRAFYDAWWGELEPTFAQTTEIHLGHPDHPVVSLTGHDWIQDTVPPWNQQHIREADGYAHTPQKGQQGKKAVPAAKSVHRGHWAVKVVAPGTYRISLRRWPLEADASITAALPPGTDVPGATKAFRARPGVGVPATSATLRLNGKDLEIKPVQRGNKEVTFTAQLTAGSHQLAPTFVDDAGNEIGAYYASIQRLP